jgi:hypothetical protein
VLTLEISILFGINNRAPHFAIVENNAVVNWAGIGKVLDRILEDIETGVQVGLGALILLSQGGVCLGEGSKLLLNLGNEQEVLLLEFSQTFLFFVVEQSH